MVERPDEAHALIEVTLRLGRLRRHRAVEAAEPVVEPRALRPVCERLRRPRGVIVMLGRGGRGEDERQSESERRTVTHIQIPPCRPAAYAVAAYASTVWPRAD